MCYSIYFPIFISIVILKREALDDDRSIDLFRHNISLHRLVHEQAEFPLRAWAGEASGGLAAVAANAPKRQQKDLAQHPTSSSTPTFLW